MCLSVILVKNLYACTKNNNNIIKWGIICYLPVVDTEDQESSILHPNSQN